MMLARPIRVKATAKQGQYPRATHLGRPHRQTSTFVVLTGSAGGEDRANAVSVDAAGDVIAAGVVRNKVSRADFVVVKRARDDGRELWRAVVNGTANGDDQANAVAVDPVGDVVAAGVILSDNGGFAVVKLAGATGTERWRTTLNGSANAFGEALAVTVDRTGMSWPWVASPTM